MRGRNVEDTEFVKAGSYHTIEIEPNRPFEVGKQSWDALDIERLKEACNPAASADLAVMLVTVSTSQVTPCADLFFVRPLLKDVNQKKVYSLP